MLYIIAVAYGSHRSPVNSSKQLTLLRKVMINYNVRLLSVKSNSSSGFGGEAFQIVNPRYFVIISSLKDASPLLDS